MTMDVSVFPDAFGLGAADFGGAASDANGDEPGRSSRARSAAASKRRPRNASFTGNTRLRAIIWPNTRLPQILRRSSRTAEGRSAPAPIPPVRCPEVAHTNEGREHEDRQLSCGGDRSALGLRGMRQRLRGRTGLQALRPAK